MAKNGRLAGFGFEKLISHAGPLPEAVENLGAQSGQENIGEE